MPPKPHLDLKLMQCFPDVGGCDAWLSGFWEANPVPNQWFTGWHLPGPAGLDGLRNWRWPDPSWTLIGYEWWAYFKRGERLLEAYYVHPYPSMSRQAHVPNGHWHMWWDDQGQEKGCE